MMRNREIKRKELYIFFYSLASPSVLFLSRDKFSVYIKLNQEWKEKDKERRKVNCRLSSALQPTVFINCLGNARRKTNILVFVSLTILGWTCFLMDGYLVYIQIKP